MNKLAVIAASSAAPFLCASTVTQGHLYGRYSDGVYLAPGKLFKMSSPFPDQPVVSDGRQPENNNAGAVSFIDDAGRLLGVLYMENKGDSAGAKADATRQLGRLVPRHRIPALLPGECPGFEGASRRGWQRSTASPPGSP